MFRRNNTVGSFDFVKPSKRAVPIRKGRGASSKRDMGIAFDEIVMIMSEKMTVIDSGYGKLTGIRVSATRTSPFVRFLSFAQAVGLNATSESDCKNKMSQVLAAAQSTLRPDPNFMFKGIYIFTKMEDFVNYFLVRIAIGVFKNKGNIKNGRMEIFAADLVSYVNAYGSKGHSTRPSRGFNSYDWAIIADGISEASTYSNEVSANAEAYHAFPILAGGYINFAMQAGSVKSYTAVRSRVDLEFVRTTSISKMTGPKIARYGGESKEEKKRQKVYLDALGRTCAVIADRASASAIKSSLALSIIKSGGLKSLVGDLYLMKSINGYFGGLTGARAVEYGHQNDKGQDVVIGKAIVNGSNFKNALGNTQLAKLSIRSMAGRILILGLIRYMISQINSNPTEFVQFTSRQPQEIISQLKKMESNVASFRKLGKGLIFYIKLDGGFANMLKSTAGEAELKMFATLVGSKSGGSTGPAIKYSESAIFGRARVGTGTTAGFRNLGMVEEEEEEEVGGFFAPPQRTVGRRRRRY